MDHDDSESSEKDRLRRQFSVAAHPSTSMLVCSDGYNFTILRWEEGEGQGLLGVVTGLVNDSRQRLGLDAQLPIPSGLEAETATKPRRSMRSVRSFVATLTQGSDLAASMLSQSLENPDGLLGKFEGREGHQGDRGQHTSSADHVSSAVLSSDSLSLHHVVCLLQTAIGMLLSCEPFVPCNGMLPMTKSFDLDQVAEYRSRLQNSTKLLISAVAKVISEASTLSTTSHIQPEVANMSHDFIASLLRLISLDKLRQNHMELSLSMTNTILMASLPGLLECHCDFSKLHRNQHTLLSLKEFINRISIHSHNLHSLLEEIVSVLETTYSSRPSIFGEVLTSSHPYHRGTSCVHYLTLTLRAILNLVAVVWKDVRLSKSLARSIQNSNQFQIVETELLRSVKTGSGVASSALKALYYYVHNLLSSSWYQLTSSKAPPPVLKDGKQTTSRASSPHTDLKEFLDSLLRYDVTIAMDVVHRCIRECDRCPSGQALSVEQLSDILDSSIVNRPDFALHVCVRSDSARVIVGMLGDLMAAYFTNKQLLILVSGHAPSSMLPVRHAELSKSKLGAVLQDEDLANSWTVERAVNLLLLAGKWERACDLIVEVGDWRKAFVLATIFSVHHRNLSLKGKMGSLNTSTAPRNPLSVLSHNLVLDNTLKVIGGVCKKASKSYSTAMQDDGDRVNEISRKACEKFLSSTFYVCALARADSVLVSCVSHYLKDLLALGGSVCTRVPAGLHLPTPPLYCAQPAQTEEVCATTHGSYVARLSGPCLGVGSGRGFSVCVCVCVGGGGGGGGFGLKRTL